MPLKVRRILASSFIAIFGSVSIIHAQTPTTAEPNSSQANGTIQRTPTAAEIMFERIAKAKAFIAVRNHTAAIFELDNIRRESGDPTVNSVANVLLIKSLLEQGNYRRTQELVREFYKGFKANNAFGDIYYPAAAAQVIKSARSQVDRYRTLGLSVADRNLPLEAITDIEQMRATLEMVIEQAKEAGSDEKRAAVALPLLEEAATARTIFSREEYDARRWREEAADTREKMARSRSVVLDASEPEPIVLVAMAPQGSAAVEPASAGPNTANGADPKPDGKPVEQPRSTGAEPAERERPVVVVGSGAREAKDALKEDMAAGPIEVGSLIGYATRQAQPAYPAAARQARTTGIVRVEVLVNEKGEVAEVLGTTGNPMLQAAARDAIVRWQFRPFTREGEPVRAKGFVNFNFSL
jgi:TonB family protein